MISSLRTQRFNGNVGASDLLVESNLSTLCLKRSVGASDLFTLLVECGPRAGCIDDLVFDGTTWGDAYTYPQDALQYASSHWEIDQIWGAAGTNFVYQVICHVWYVTYDPFRGSPDTNR